MPKIRLVQVAALAAALLVAGCATQGRVGTGAYPTTLKEKGYLVELAGVTAGDQLDTPPAIPSMLDLELEKQLMTAGLLPVQGQPGKRLRLEVETTAIYRGMSAPYSIDANYSYTALVSVVTLTEIRTSSVVARTDVRTYNGFGSWTADSTVMIHAEDIVRFVSSVDPP